MTYVIKAIYVFILSLSLSAQWTTFDLNTQIELHLNEFSHLQVSHHDNIDDEAHGHTHKHSENGEEHEHHHEHGKAFASEDRLTIKRELKSLSSVQLPKIKINFEKNLISNAHPFEIFRPPIA